MSEKYYDIVNIWRFNMRRYNVMAGRESRWNIKYKRNIKYAEIFVAA